MIELISSVIIAIKIQDMLLASLMEMEFLHRQEELEHLELERALTLSMAAEEERLRALTAEAKQTDFEDEYNYDAPHRSEAKVGNLCNSDRVQSSSY